MASTGNVKVPWINTILSLGISVLIVVWVPNHYLENSISSVNTLSDFTIKLEERITSLMKIYDVPGVNIALVREGRTVWMNSYGFADRANLRKMSLNTYYRVESISKPVTAWGVMKLVQQGKVHLDSPVVSFLETWSFPPSGFSEDQVTIRQLLSNSSGLPLGTIGERYDPAGPMPSLRDQLTRDAVLLNEPGELFSYSNVGFNLLELVIEEVSDRDFSSYMEREILEPLQMYHSGYAWSDTLQSLLATGYSLQGTPISPYVYPVKGAGGLIATVEDIARFVEAEVNGREQVSKVLRAANKQALFSPVVEIPGYYGLVFDAYGLGHFLEQLPTGQRAVSHGGQGTGWMTHFHAVPETGDGIVILSNSQRSWPVFAYLLKGWAQWCGFDSVGMVSIITAQNLLWALITLLLASIFFFLCKFAGDLYNGRRRIRARSSSILSISVLFQLLVFFGTAAVLVWAVTREYLFITSVFPVAAVWLGYVIALCSLCCLLFVLVPHSDPAGNN